MFLGRVLPYNALKSDGDQFLPTPFEACLWGGNYNHSIGRYKSDLYPIVSVSAYVRPYSTKITYKVKKTTGDLSYATPPS